MHELSLEEMILQAMTITCELLVEEEWPWLDGEFDDDGHLLCCLVS